MSIFIVSYNALDAKSHGFIIDDPSNQANEDDVIEIAKAHLQRVFQSHVDELIELESIENWDVIECDTLEAIEQ